MKSLAAIATASLLSLNPTDAHAVTATEIEAQDVYQAGYCSELLRLGRGAVPREPSEIIQSHSKNLIEGGDNLEFVAIGEDDARRDYLKLIGVEGGRFTEDTSSTALIDRLMSCKDTLQEIVSGYRAFSCGYGTKRNNGPALEALLRLLEREK